MFIGNKFLLVLATLALSACATTYQPDGFTGGFSETQLSENTFIINVSGNGYTSRSRVKEIALLRAADLASKHGFRYFELIDESSSSTAYTTNTRSNYNTTGRIDGSGNFSARTTGGSNPITFNKPENEIMVYLHKDKPISGRPFFEATFVCESLAPKLNTQCGKH